MARNTVEIGPRTLLGVAALVVGLWLLWHLGGVLVLIFISALIASALSPVVGWLERWLPRWLAVLLLLLTVVSGFALAFYLLIPPMIHEAQTGISDFESGRIRLDFELFGNHIDSQMVAAQARTAVGGLSSHLGSLVGATRGVITGAFGVVTVIVLAFYMLLDEPKLRGLVAELAPTRKRRQVLRIITDIGDKMGLWLRGQIVLSLIIGVAAFVGLLIFGVKYALALAILAAITELLPIIGPFIGAGAAIIVAAADSWTKAIVIGIWYLVIQQLEAHVLVPQVMRRALGLSPVMVVIAILVGGELYGFLGILLSIPAAAALGVLVHEWETLTDRS